MHDPLGINSKFSIGSNHNEQGPVKAKLFVDLNGDPFGSKLLADIHGSKFLFTVVVRVGSRGTRDGWLVSLSSLMIEDEFSDWLFVRSFVSGAFHEKCDVVLDMLSHYNSFSFFFFFVTFWLMLCLPRAWIFCSLLTENQDTPISNALPRLTSVKRFCEMLKATTLKVGWCDLEWFNSLRRWGQNTFDSECLQHFLRVLFSIQWSLKLNYLSSVFFFVIAFSI